MMIESVRGLIGEKGAAASGGRSPTGMVGASKVGYHSNGFAFLTAAPGNGWSDPDALTPEVLQDLFSTNRPVRGTHPSSMSYVRRFSGKRSERRHALM